MAPREHNDSLARLLRRGLQVAAEDSAAACPDAETLAAYYERSLAAVELAHWEQHFSVCSRCREQLASLVRSDPTLAPTLPQAQVPLADPVGFSARAARRGLESLWQRHWRWLAPAAAATCALAVWLALGPTSPRIAPAEPRSESVVSPPAAVPAVPAKQNPVAPLAAEGAAEQSKPRADKAHTFARTRVIPPTASLDQFKKEAAKSAQAGGARMSGNEREKTEAADQAVAAEKKPALAPELAIAESQTRRASRSVSVPPPTLPSAQGLQTTPMAQPSGVAKTQPQADNSYFREHNRMMTGAVGRLEPSEEMILAPQSGVRWRLRPGAVVERSSDGGKTWEQQSVPLGSELLAGAAVSDKVCWLVGRGGLVLRTTDGQTWKRLRPPEAVDLGGVEARSADSAIVFTADGKGYITEDGGKTWRGR